MSTRLTRGLGTDAATEFSPTRRGKRTRSSAVERRNEVIAAAVVEFASGGFAGTSTDAIARRAGVSQPYLFQLFRTKKGLFLAAVRACFDRTGRLLEDAARETARDSLGVEQMLQAMDHAYARLLLSDRNLLRLQLHAYAASTDPEIRAVARRGLERLWLIVADLSGAEPAALRASFAQEMLINVIACMGESATDDDSNLLRFGGIRAVASSCAASGAP